MERKIVVAKTAKCEMYDHYDMAYELWDSLDAQSDAEYEVPAGENAAVPGSVIHVDGIRVVIPSVHLSARFGELCVPDEETGGMDPDYSVCLLYPETERDPLKYLGWVQGGLEDALSATNMAEPIVFDEETECILEIEAEEGGADENAEDSADEKEEGMDEWFSRVEEVRRVTHRSWINLKNAALLEMGQASGFGTENVRSTSLSVLRRAEEASGRSAAEILRVIEARGLA